MAEVRTDKWLAPREAPLTYPGARPDGSFLVLGDVLHRLRPQPARRLGYCRVEVGTDQEVMFLDRFLHRRGEISMGTRHPILAFGSNASPAQLRHKFAESGVSCVVPVTAIDMTGARAGIAAWVSPYDAIPSALVRDAEGVHRSWITWLDDEQLACVDRSEDPFGRVEFLPESGATFTVVGSGEVLTGVQAYRSSTTPVLEVDGVALGPAFEIVPWAQLGRLSDPEGAAGNGVGRSGRSGPPPTAMDQRTLVRLARGGRGVTSERASSPVGLQREPDALAWLAAHAVPDGLDGLVAPCPPGTASPTYDGLPSTLTLKHPTESTPLVAITTDAFIEEHPRPPYSFCVFLPPKEAARFPSGWASVRPAETHTVNIANSTFAQVIAADGVPAGHVGVDITLRFGIGVTARDLVHVDPVLPAQPETLRDRIGERLFPSRVSLARVVTAEAAMAEMRSAYVDPGLMAFVGVKDGDRVFLSHVKDGRVTRRWVRAFTVPEALGVERLSRERSRVGAKYPSCGDLLGVESDFGKVYIDAEDRAALGVDRCGAVQITADWRDQVSAAIRDMGLLVVVAAFGLAAFADGLVARVVVVVSLLVAAITLAVWAVRRRLG